MTTAPTVDPELRATGRKKSFRWLWITASVLVLAGAGIALWLVLSGDGQPTITYDGTAAVYSGPDELEAGIHTFRLENNSESAVDFHYARHDPEFGEVTFEEVQAWAGTDAPPWVEELGLFTRARAGLVVEESAEFVAGSRYELIVYDVQTGEGHAASVIEVAPLD